MTTTEWCSSGEELHTAVHACTVSQRKRSKEMAEAREVSEDMDLEKKSRTLQLLQKYMDCAEFLIQKCRSLQNIKGMQKLERKCQAEFKYLKSLSKRRGGFDSSHLRSSNLSHYLGIVHATGRLPDVTHVLQAFRCPARTDALHADIVAGQGQLWVKVVARKAQALHLVWAGRGQYGEKDLIQQANDFLVCSAEHPINFETPELVFAFYNGVTEPMADHLKDLGIAVVGNQVEVSSDVTDKLVNIDTEIEDEECLDTDTPLVEARVSNSSASDRGMCDLGECERHMKELSLHPETYTEQHISSEEPSPESKSTNQHCDKHETIEDIAENNRDSSTVTAASSDSDCDIGLGIPSTNGIHDFIFQELIVLPMPDYSRVISAFNIRPRNSADSIDKVNLDVTALITIVSNVANGSCHFQFNEPVLSAQAEEERTKPVKEELDAFIKGKTLFACETAVASFRSILDLLGGAEEKARGAALLDSLTVVSDRPSFRTAALDNTAKIKDRSKIVFGTGDSLKAVTVTANSGFVRAAEHQGVMYSVFLHSSRALTEQKEPHAERLTPDP